MILMFFIRYFSLIFLFISILPLFLKQVLHNIASTIKLYYRPLPNFRLTFVKAYWVLIYLLEQCRLNAVFVI
jgi:hypothetical protein